jgi:uncharacterized SAM-binding protein YcdF (DUF218 family)
LNELIWSGLRLFGFMFRTICLVSFFALIICTLALIRWPEPTAGIFLDTLQGRYARPDLVPEASGIIVLGGGIHSFIHDRGGGAGQRIVAALDLLRANPHYALVATGAGEAFQMPGLLRAQGLEPKTYLVGDARDTYQEASQAAAILGARKRETWLLVTSAWHMPRAVASFRGQGVNVAPWPVDAITASNAHALEIVTKEFLGLIGYLLIGRIGPWPALRHMADDYF